MTVSICHAPMLMIGLVQVVDSLTLPSAVDASTLLPDGVQQAAKQLFQAAQGVEQTNQAPSDSPAWRRLVFLAQGDVTPGSEFMKPIEIVLKALLQHSQKQPLANEIPLLRHTWTSAEELLDVLKATEHKVWYKPTMVCSCNRLLC